MIVVRTCDACPHVDHKGAFGNPAYVPLCRKTMRKDRVLPYTVVVSNGLPERSGWPLVAVPSGVIPDWCPLHEIEVTA